MAKTEREQFETWAEDVYGGDARRHFIRDTTFPNEYAAADVQWAWKAWEYRAQLKS